MEKIYVYECSDFKQYLGRVRYAYNSAANEYIEAPFKISDKLVKNIKYNRILNTSRNFIKNVQTKKSKVFKLLPLTNVPVKIVNNICTVDGFKFELKSPVKDGIYTRFSVGQDGDKYFIVFNEKYHRKDVRKISTNELNKAKARIYNKVKEKALIDQKKRKFLKEPEKAQHKIICRTKYRNTLIKSLNIFNEKYRLNLLLFTEISKFESPYTIETQDSVRKDIRVNDIIIDELLKEYYKALEYKDQYLLTTLIR